MQNDYHNTRANEFDALVGEIEIQDALAHTEEHRESVLDIGCGIGSFTASLVGKFNEVFGLDLSYDNIQYAKKNIVGCDFIEANAESFVLNRTFSSIFLLNILEHVNDPIAVLKNVSKHLEPNGIVVIQVPNALSINRQIGYEMGLISSLNELSQEEIDLYGHKRVYTPFSLKQDITKSGLKISFQHGVVFKPLTNAQMQKICDDKTIEWSRDLVSALQVIGERFPLECTGICCVCRL